MKSTYRVERVAHTGRSREGAWIEILEAFIADEHLLRRSREGAWIEIPGIPI